MNKKRTYLAPQTDTLCLTSAESLLALAATSGRAEPPAGQNRK